MSRTKALSAARIAVLLDYPGHGDSRVNSHCRALRHAGHHVQLFTLVRSGDDNLRGKVSIDGVKVEEIYLDDSKIVPFLAMLGRRSSQERHKAKAKSRHSNTAQSSTLSTPFLPDTQDYTLKPISLKAIINRTLGALFWHRAVSQVFAPSLRQFEPDIVIANDLSTLGAGTYFARQAKSAVIYDAHEYEQGRNGVPSTLAEAVRQAFERLLIRRADRVMTVGVAIARILQRDYSLSKVPDVVMNTASLPIRTKSVALLPSQLRVDPSCRVAIYVGSPQQGRGVEIAIAALVHVPSLHLCLMGDADEARWESLLAYADDLSVAKRLHRIHPVAPEAVSSFVAQADVSIIPIQPTCTSYKYCLPNKLFQSLVAETPVVASPLPEIAAVLNYTGGGLIARSETAEAFAEALLADKRKPSQLSHTYTRDGADETLRSIVAEILSFGTHEALPLPPHAKDPALQAEALKTLPNATPIWKRTLASLLVRIARLWTFY